MVATGRSTTASECSKWRSVTGMGGIIKESGWRNTSVHMIAGLFGRWLDFEAQSVEYIGDVVSLTYGGDPSAQPLDKDAHQSTLFLAQVTFSLSDQETAQPQLGPASVFLLLGARIVTGEDDGTRDPADSDTRTLNTGLVLTGPSGDAAFKVYRRLQSAASRVAIEHTCI